ncbi:protein Aster-B isoform X2 [Lucilia sericata]|uniref:protein Aster-B isoform X2 n=1 Tax=Lucilia sericata TaxID=13632 RepID=UPI0018A8219D|nr:protein Aster-B isoform X2 [Lucilia sericata]
MNFGITQIATTTTYTNTNNTVTTTATLASVSTATVSDSISKDTATFAPTRTETQISSNVSDNIGKQDSTSNSINPSKSFTTPQNCLEILTSIQNKTVPSDCASTTNSFSTASSNNSSLILPTSSSSSLLTSSSATRSPLEALGGIQSMKLLLPEDLTKQINSTLSDNSTNIENTIKSTFSSISNSITGTVTTLKNDNLTTQPDLSQSRESLKLQTERNICSNIEESIELDDKLNDLSLSESKISINSANILRCDEDSLSKSSENSGDLLRNLYSSDCIDKIKNVTRLSERAKKKSWYNVLYPNYKSRSQDFKKLFKEVPNDERLIVDYSCALYRDLLIQGRLYISQNYVCFHANILGWETCLIIKWKDVTSITKEKTALVIPNAISICTPKEKYFFSSFTTRDKTFLILFRVWQNTLMNKPMPAQEIWQLVHNYYGDELGLTTDDEDYIDPTVEDRDDGTSNIDFVSAIDDSNSLSVYQEAIERSNSNIYQAIDSSSGNSASNNNSGNNSASSGDCINSKIMKSNAKELTLISAKPEDGFASNSQTQQTSATSGGSGSGSAVTGSHSANVSKESKHNTSTFDSKRKVSKNNRQREENTNKNSETLPTDISDSSDSEENNIPFVATAECNSPHEGRQLVHTILPINIETLFNLLFSKSKFLLDFHAMRKSTDLVFGEWITNEDGQKTRTFNVTVQLAASVGPKTSKVTEFQVMRDCSKPGELYSIDINNVNAGIPYADSFSVLVHYCLVKTVDDHTMLSVHAQIKYKKSIWGVVKGFIEKNTWAGLDDFYTSLLHSLQSETCIPPAKGKGRRPRRGKHKPINALCVIATLSEDGGQTITSSVTSVDENEYLGNSNKNIVDPCFYETTTIHCHCRHHSNHNHSHHYHRHCQCPQHKKESDKKGTAAQIRPLEEMPILPIKPEPADHSGIAQTISTRHPIDSPVVAVEATTKFRWLSLFVLVLLCFLIIVNVILLLKLWKLEERIDEDMSTRARMPNLSALKQLPNNHEDWIELLRQQEILHETELKKWHTVLQTAIELLKKTERTLAELMFR